MPGTGGVAQTDKLYTASSRSRSKTRPGRGDAALRLYNYKARFNSTVLAWFVKYCPNDGRSGTMQSP